MADEREPAAAVGDPHVAFVTGVFVRFQRSLLRYLRDLLTRREDVEDVAQETYLRLVRSADDASIPAEEFVTRVLAPKNIQAAVLAPILRPLMPQSAHLAAHADSNQLVLMDRYANVQRITAIVRSLDVPSARQNQ